VLHDIATTVWRDEPFDVTTGHVNVIWQGDANGQALGLLAHCAAPPFVCNITGPETVSIRRVAEQFAELLGVEARMVGSEAPTALLSNAARAQQLFGYPTVSLRHMLEWIADWVSRGGALLNKPTHFETRDGKF
jgi:nucleoside-diphosphate-sugar epimerase